MSTLSHVVITHHNLCIRPWPHNKSIGRSLPPSSLYCLVTPILGMQRTNKRTTKACTSTTYNGCLGLAVSWVMVLLHNLHLPSSNRDKRGLNEVLWRSRGHFKVIHSNILAGKEETLGSRNLLKGIWSTSPAFQCCGSRPSMHALQSFEILNSCSTLNLGGIESFFIACKSSGRKFPSPP